MITSKENELIKHIRSLSQKKYREQYGEFFVEGIKLVKEAIEQGVPIKKIMVCEELFQEKISFGDYAVEYVSKNVFQFISDTDTPQGVLAVIAKKEEEKIEDSVIFALDNIQDPGNLGTILRTLDCAGLRSVLLSENTVDVYNPKVIRSTMGAIYRVNVKEQVDLKLKLQDLQTMGYRIIVTAFDTSQDIYQIDFQHKCVIVIGNESKGVSKEVQALADEKVKIPMFGKTESLNAAVAASIIMYEYVRQRKS